MTVEEMHVPEIREITDNEFRNLSDQEFDAILDQNDIEYDKFITDLETIRGF